MKNLVLFFFFLGLFSFNFGYEFELEESPIVELEPSNFYSEVYGSSLTAVMFYAPWCGACKKFFPKYEKVQLNLDGDARLFAFDATNTSPEYKEILKDFDIGGYPTLYIFNEGKAIEYRRPFEEEPLTKLLRKLASPILLNLTMDMIKEGKLVNSMEPSIVGFFSSTNQPEYQLFHELALKNRTEFKFFTVFNVETIQKEFQVETIPTIRIVKSFDQNVVHVNDFTQLETSMSWHRFPIFGNINKEISDYYVLVPIPIVYLWIKPDQVETLTPLITKLANEFKLNYNFVHIDWDTYKNKLFHFGLNDQRVPTLSVENTSTRLRWGFPENKELTFENIKEFLLGIQNKTIEPFFRSAPIPEVNNEPVKVVVTKEWNKYILDPENDVLLEIYAPWCGHCKKLAPIWEELGNLLKDVEDLIITKFDGDANELDPRYGFAGTFPSIALFKKNNKSEPIKFTSTERTKEKILDFIIENASNSISEKVQKIKNNLNKLKSEL